MTPYPNLDHSGPLPIYQQIVAWIRQQINTGVWPARFKLKAEVDLALELGVSRGTVRKALAELTAEGLLVQTHGRGTFVAPHVVEQPLADRLVTFSEALASKGIAYDTRVLVQAVTPARGRVAVQLQLRPEEPVFYLQRVRAVDGEPLIVLNNYVPYGRCPGIERVDFTAAQLFHVLEEQYRLRLAQGTRTFQAQACEREVAHLLKLEPGDPVMHLEQVTRLADGSVIEWSNLYLRGDSFRLMADVSRGERGDFGVAMAMVTSPSASSFH